MMVRQRKMLKIEGWYAKTPMGTIQEHRFTNHAIKMRQYPHYLYQKWLDIKYVV
jgi:hypothetical protein